ncbi:MAG: hypothetical protein H8D45_30490 [Bacteroidetes bacterium]|nr:hypothetical protein [Bacteroidota bacterium]
MKPSYKSFRFLLIACTLLLISRFSFSQNQVIVNIEQPLYNQLNVEDVWKINLTNTTNNVLSVYLFGTLSEENAGLIATGTSKVFSLNPGFKKIKSGEITPITIDYPNPDSKYKESMIRTGGVPTGNYEVCISVKLSSSNNEVGSGCINQKVEMSAPLSLIAPDNGEKISLILPTFTWMHLKKPGSDASYTITVVELLPNQTPELAILTNPSWFTKEKITSTVFQYPLSARRFETGIEYAWQVNVFEKGVLLTESDVWSFKYENPIGPQVEVIFPKVGEEIEGDSISFEWRCSMQADNSLSYSIKVVEILNGQSPEDAIQENDVFWKKNQIKSTFLSYSDIDGEFEHGKKYSWQVSAVKTGELLAMSEVSVFEIVSEENTELDVIFPKVGEEIEGDGLFLEWETYDIPEGSVKYSLKIVEVLEGQTKEAALDNNVTLLEKNDLETSKYLCYLDSSFELDAGKKYAWQVIARNGEEQLCLSNVGSFLIKPDKE